jgi:hypothetical protein
MSGGSPETGHCRAQTAHHVDGHLDPVHVNAGELGSPLVATHGVKMEKPNEKGKFPI